MDYNTNMTLVVQFIETLLLGVGFCGVLVTLLFIIRRH